MSNVLVHSVYFPLADAVPMPFVVDLIERLGSIGLQDPASETLPTLFLSPSADDYESTSPARTLALLEEHQGGSLRLDHTEQDLVGYLNVSLCGGSYLSDLGSADAGYGSVEFSVDFAYLHPYRDGQELVHARWLTILRAWNVIAAMPGAIYGFGDDGWSLTEDAPAVLARDLDRGSIPRLAWWSYYSDSFARRIGYRKLFASGVAYARHPHGISFLLNDAYRESEGRPSAAEYGRTFDEQPDWSPYKT
jgi:hypothetical protein